MLNDVFNIRPDNTSLNRCRRLCIFPTTIHTEKTMPNPQQSNQHKSQSGATATKRRYKYTKAQVIRNRIILVLVLVALFGFSYWGIATLSQNIFGDDSSRADTSSSDISSSVPDDSTPQVIGATSSDDLEPMDSEASSDESDESEDNSEDEPVEYPNPYPYDEDPLLVNKNNPIPEDFVPQLTEISGGYQFNSTAAVALNDMMAAAYADGITLWVVSAYRSIEHQTNNYNNRVSQYVAEGYSEEEAKKLTEQFIAPPNNSEHSLGLAVDLNSLYQSFEDTPEFEWLFEHCAEYGFILRYLKDKTNITTYSYEPWHYRFVGTNHSYEIMESGLTLEEYLS